MPSELDKIVPPDINVDYIILDTNDNEFSGILNAGEKYQIQLSLKNIGDGVAYELAVSLVQISGDKIDYIELYKYLYPFQGDPLIWIHLNTDYPYDIQGILYFPKLSGRADWEKGEIKLFCNQVFVSDSIKEIVPKYLLPLRGVIDSTDIPHVEIGSS